MTNEKIFAVTGNPVLHSKSPLIFNTVFDRLGIDAVYTRLAASSHLEALSLFRKLKLSGMNVTAPFKKSIIAFLDRVDPAAAAIDGVNTVVREGDRLAGYNTDHIGVTRSLLDRGVALEGTACLVLGAGGAGRAAVYGLLQENARVTLVNRTYEKAAKVASDLGCRVEPIENLEAVLAQSRVLVSTLSSAVDIVPAQWLPETLVVFDANYKKSPLAENAASRGCTIIKGEEWLLNQAVPAYGLFMGDPRPTPFPDDLVETLKSILLSTSNRELRNLSLVGFMGSGKSLVGRRLSQRLDFSYMDTDKMIEMRSGQSIPDMFAQHGEVFFRQKERTILEAELPQYDGAVFSCGGGVVLDRDNRRVLRDNSVVVWLYTSVKTALRRIRKGSRPLLECDDPGGKARAILAERIGAYARSADMIVSGEYPADQVVEKIYAEINKTFTY